MLISELFDAICWEISVESGSTDFQLVDDITDEWIIFCVFEHRFSMLDGLFIHCPWTIATGSFKDAHFATFPPALVEPCIRAGTSERGVCPECGAPWVRHTKPATTTGKSWHNHQDDLGRGQSPSVLSNQYVPTKTLGWLQSCKCSASNPMPATVLDPFGGAGTVGLVAERLIRNSIIIEISPDYADLAGRRIMGDMPLITNLVFD